MILFSVLLKELFLRHPWKNYRLKLISLKTTHSVLGKMYSPAVKFSINRNTILYMRNSMLNRNTSNTRLIQIYPSVRAQGFDFSLQTNDHNWATVNDQLQRADWRRRRNFTSDITQVVIFNRRPPRGSWTLTMISAYPFVRSKVQLIFWLNRSKS